MFKIALPSRDGIVDEHFGHCEYFTLLAVAHGAFEGIVETITNHLCIHAYMPSC